MPTITYNLAPNPRWLLTDLTGDVLSNGKLFTYEDLNRAMPKAVYKHFDGTTPWTNPIIFSLNGMPNAEIYWSSDSYYYLAFFDQFDVPQFTVEHFNAPFAVESDEAPSIISNYIRNPQFSIWSNTTSFPNIGQSLNSYDYIADDWLFSRSNLNATVNISQSLFNLGQTDVPFNPIGYLHYECVNSGAGGETFKRIFQKYTNVQTFSLQEMIVGIYAKSSSNSAVTVNIIQNFGTGGSPSATVITPIMIASLNSNWQQYSSEITIPSVIGKSLGTNGDDYIAFSLDLPLNQVSSLDFTNCQLTIGEELPNFPYITVNEQIKLLDTTFYGIPKTGDYKFTLRQTADPGWIVCNDSTIGNSSSGSSAAGLYTKALFELLWSSVSNTYAAILNSDGSPGSRGANAEADFNANKRLTLTATLGRVLGQFNGTYPMGSPFGEANHTLTTPEIPSHSHGVSDPGHVHNHGAYTAGSATQDGFVRGDNPFIGNIGTSSSVTGITVGSTGGGGAHNNIQPTSFVNCMIKL